MIRLIRAYLRARRMAKYRRWKWRLTRMSVREKLSYGFIDPNAQKKF